jgi:thiopurine S-methyltransferase
MKKLNKTYWSARYSEHKTGWDIGAISTPIKVYIDQLEDKNIKILIPGSGNAYEASYLFEKGFRNVTVLDFAQKPLDNLKKRIPEFPNSQLINADFFSHNKQYDLIIEQTFFCALSPKLRADYAKKMSELLVPSGKLAGLLFDFPLTEKGPPYGGCQEEYLNYFYPYFKVLTMETCYNSIKPRMDNELFFILEKK